MSSELVLTVLAVVLFTVVLAVRALKGASSPRDDFEVSRRRLLTPREMQFMRILDEAIDGLTLHICPQVSPDAYLSFRGDGRNRVRGRYKASRSDFVLMDRTGNAVLVVELDDSSHDAKREADAERDRVVALGGVRTVRVPKGSLPSVQKLRASMTPALPRIARR